MFYNRFTLPGLIMLAFSGLGAMHTKSAELFALKGDLENKTFDYARTQVNEDPFLNAHEHTFSLRTESGLEFPVLHIDRGSDTVIVLGQGLSDPKEVMLPIAALFETCDVILFDYRWYDSFNSTQTKALFTGSFHNEVEEVRAVLSAAKDKGFKKVIGLGLCYSAVLFAKVQAEQGENEGFTHPGIR